VPPEAVAAPLYVRSAYLVTGGPGETTTIIVVATIAALLGVAPLGER
jgi:hypothetical protein